MSRTVSAILALSMALSYIPMVAAPAYAAPSTFTGGVDVGPAYVLNDHTVYALHLTGSGLPANKDLDISAKLSNTGAAGGYGDAPGFDWNATAGRWVQSREAATSNGTMHSDGSGNVAGWFYFKCGDENFTGFPAGNGHGANQAYLTVQIQDGLASSYNPTVRPIVTVIDAKTQGAWVHNGVATGLAEGTVLTASSLDGSSTYSVQKAEANLTDDDDNGLVDDEDYGPIGAAGDFRFGVPTGVEMNVSSLGGDWTPGQDATAGPADTDIAIGAADQTPPSAPTGLVTASGDGTVTLNWSAASDTGGAGIAGYRIYRMKGTSYETTGTGDPTLTTALPKLVGAVGAATENFTDATVVNGTQYTYFVRAADGATNYSARSNQAVATPHAPGPPVTTFSGNLGWSTSSPATFSLDATGDAPPFTRYYGLNGGSVAEYSSPVSVSTQGTTTVSYFSTNSLGQTETTKTALVRIDTGKPTTTIGGLPAGGIAPGPVTFTLSPSDSVSGVGPTDTKYKLDSNPATTTYSAHVTVSDPGTHTILYWSKDVAGNKENNKTATFRVSAGAPVTSLSGVPSGWTSATVDFSLSATGDVPPITTFYALGSGAVTTYTAPVTVSSQGATTLTYYSTDSIGHDETAKTATIRIDTAKPSTSSDAAGPYGAGGASITLSPSDTGGSGVANTYYRLDGGAQTSGTSISVTSAGSHNLEFWSVDGAGNEETPHKAASFSIASPPPPGADTTAPVTLSDAAGPYSGSATIHLTPADNPGGSGLAHTYYSLDGGTPTEGTVVVVSEAGTHTLEFFSVDLVGNVEYPHKTATFSVVAIPDTTPPTTSSDATAAYTGTATINLSATDSEGGSGVASTHYRLDNGIDTVGTLVTTSALGNHTLEFWSIDTAGNAETPHKSATFAVNPVVTPKQATKLTIKTSATSARIGKSFILSGIITPNAPALVGKWAIVWVKKPGKTYWTYSSNRVIYSNRGVASWWYRYDLKRGLNRGTYQFRTTFKGNAAFLSSTSPTVKVLVR